MATWSLQDIQHLGPAARAQVLARLAADAERDRAAGRPVDPEIARTLKANGVTLTPPKARPAPGEPGKRTRRPVGAQQDVGDLYEPTDRAAQDHTGSLTLVMLDTVETANNLGGAHAMQLHRVEKRWTTKAQGLCEDWAIRPMRGPVDITAWVLSNRNAPGKVNNAAALADAGAAAHAIKGAVDGIVRAGILPDDGPGFVRRQVMLEAVWADADGLVITVTPALPFPDFPLVTIPPQIGT